MEIKGIHKFRLLKDTKREYQEIQTPEKLNYILNEYVGKRPLNVRFTDPVVQATPTDINEDNQISLQFPNDFDVPEEFTLFKTMNKQMEFDCRLLESKNGIAVAQVTTARIDTKARKLGRLLNPDDSIISSNFYISKNKIDMNPMWYSVSNRVIFHEEEKRLQTEYPGLKVVEMNPIESNWESKLLKKSREGFLVQDMSQPELKWQYDLVPEQKHVDESAVRVEPDEEAIEDMQKRFRDQSVKSWIVVPLIYTNLQGVRFPIGYLQRESEDQPFGKGDMENLSKVSIEIIDRIKDANTILVNQKQPVVNIGLGGAMLRIAEPEFQQYLLHRNEMVFDIIFKLQQPLRFYAEIKHIREKDTNELYVGLEFKGLVNSDKSGMTSIKRLQEYIKYMVEKGAPYEAPVAS